jgi:excisionase family DNA binding protein
MLAGVSANADSSPSTSCPRLALSKAEAAEALGVSVDFLERHVMAELRVIRRGRRRLIPVRELERWLEHNATRALDRP